MKNEPAEKLLGMAILVSDVCVDLAFSFIVAETLGVVPCSLLCIW